MGDHICCCCSCVRVLVDSFSKCDRSTQNPALQVDKKDSFNSITIIPPFPVIFHPTPPNRRHVPRVNRCPNNLFPPRSWKIQTLGKKNTQALGPSKSPRPTPRYTLRDQLGRLLTFVMKPFVTTPGPSAVSSTGRHEGTESMGNLFGAPGVGRSPRANVLPGLSQQYPPAFRLHRTRR